MNLSIVKWAQWDKTWLNTLYVAYLWLQEPAVQGSHTRLIEDECATGMMRQWWLINSFHVITGNLNWFSKLKLV